MAKTLEQQLEELDARRDALKHQIRERDKRERARADAALLRAVKDCLGDGIAAKAVRPRFGKRGQPEPPQPSEQRKDG